MGQAKFNLFIKLKNRNDHAPRHSTKPVLISFNLMAYLLILRGWAGARAKLTDLRRFWRDGWWQPENLPAAKRVLYV